MKLKIVVLVVSLAFGCTLLAQTFTTTPTYTNTNPNVKLLARLSGSATPLVAGCTCSAHVENQLTDSVGNPIDGGWYGTSCTNTLAPLLQDGLLEDTEYQWGTAAYEETTCNGTRLMHWIQTAIWSRFRLAHTRTVVNGTIDNCSGNPELCDYGVVSWCTPATTPPTYDPDKIRDAYPINPTPDGWEAHSFCIKQLDGTWKCDFNTGSFAIRLYGVFNQEACSVFP